MKKTHLAIVAIIILSFSVSIYIYPQMPDMIASHWNSEGDVDGYMSKSWGLFLMPIISIVLLLFFIFLPKTDPLKKNINQFKKYFDGFILIMFLFLFYIHLLTLSWNLNYNFSMTRMLLPALGLLFFYLGFFLEKVKQNWFIGIRTPWTLSNQEVWDKTHKMGGRVFKLSGLVAIAGMIFQDIAFWLFIGVVVTGVICLFIYSYVIFKKLDKNQKV